jgi:RHS repeat-associated protein
MTAPGENWVTVDMSAPAPAYRFTGREDDEPLYLYYYRARYYHTDLQRFISEDPIGLAGGDINLYAYVRNRPTRLVDPRGLQQMEPVDPVFGPPDPTGCMPSCTTVGDVINREFERVKERYGPMVLYLIEHVARGYLAVYCGLRKVECPDVPIPGPRPADALLPKSLESEVVSVPRWFPLHGRKDLPSGVF